MLIDQDSLSRCRREGVVIVSIWWSVVECCLHSSCLASVVVCGRHWSHAGQGVQPVLIVVDGVFLFWWRLPLYRIATMVMVVSLVVSVEFEGWIPSQELKGGSMGVLDRWWKAARSRVLKRCLGTISIWQLEGDSFSVVVHEWWLWIWKRGMCERLWQAEIHDEVIYMMSFHLGLEDPRDTYTIFNKSSRLPRANVYWARTRLLRLTFWIGSWQLTMADSHKWLEIVQSRTTPRGGVIKSDGMMLHGLQWTMTVSLA